ncbi:MAG TPA: hypothetical protein VIY70_04445 [Acidimicrobiia bacterium]
MSQPLDLLELDRGAAFKGTSPVPLEVWESGLAYLGSAAVQRREWAV